MRERRQNLVIGAVAVRIVDLLEVIDVDQQQRPPPLWNGVYAPTTRPLCGSSRYAPAPVRKSWLALCSRRRISLRLAAMELAQSAAPSPAWRCPIGRTSGGYRGRRCGCSAFHKATRLAEMLLISVMPVNQRQQRRGTAGGVPRTPTAPGSEGDGARPRRYRR